MNHILEDFYKALGHTINRDKSSLYYSKNVKEDISSRLSNSLEIVETKDLGKYLGVPQLHKKVSQATFTGLVEKVKDRARNWLANRIYCHSHQEESVFQIYKLDVFPRYP